MKVHFVLLIGSKKAEGNNNGKLFGKLFRNSHIVSKHTMTFLARTNRFWHQIEMSHQ